MRPSYLVQDTLAAAGLEHVRREERNSYWLKNPELDADLQTWFRLSFQTTLPRVFLLLGRVKHERSANALADEALKEINEDFKSGTVPNFPQRVILGSKLL